MRKGIFLAISLGLVAALAGGSAMAAGDAEIGAKVFKKRCKTCHTVKAGKHKLGPSLAGMFGSKSGATDFKKYKGLKGSDFVWNEENLDKFLANPKKFVGKKSMTFKLKKANERANVIEYLKTLK
ncbi:MAG: c-type cytochrome [Rhodospirillales bacterium]